MRGVENTVSLEYLLLCRGACPVAGMIRLGLNFDELETLKFLVASDWLRYKLPNLSSSTRL